MNATSGQRTSRGLSYSTAVASGGQPHHRHSNGLPLSTRPGSAVKSSSSSNSSSGGKASGEIHHCKECKTLREDRDKMASELQQLKSENDKLVKVNAEIVRSNAELKRKANTPHLEVSTLREECKVLRQDRDKMVSELKQLKSEIDKVNAELVLRNDELKRKANTPHLKVTTLREGNGQAHTSDSKAIERSSEGSTNTRTSSIGVTNAPVSSSQQCGLHNLGHSCYMNAALQCLNSATLFREYFLEECTEGEGLLRSYKDLVRTMCRGHERSVEPDQLASEMAKICSYFDGKSQQDSQEFLAVLLENLHDALKTTEEQSVAGPVTSSTENSIITSLFQGQLRSHVVCETCKKSTEHCDPFMFLPLAVPEEFIESRMLEDLLQSLTKKEYFADDQWYCSQCSGTAAMTRLVELAQAPELLIVYLKRFKITTYGYRTKITTRVEYPLHGFELRPNEPDSQDVYNLFAVISHVGTLSAGCYTAICKRGDQWYRFLDSRVVAMKEADVVTRDAYVLFYQRTQRTQGLCGMPSFGGTCYISAAMQCLFSLPAVMEYFQQWAKTFPKSEVFNALSEVMDGIQRGNVPPSDYKRNIELLTSMFPREKDPLGLITSLLMRELPLIELFQGSVQTTIQCTQEWCSKKEIHETQFISVPIQASYQQVEPIDLQKCLESNVKINTWHCAQCYFSLPLRKVTEIMVYPRVLVLQLEYFNSKNTIVNFHDSLYDLTAVINFYDTTSAGHYTALCKRNGKWYEFDDEKVTPISPGEVVTPAAYVLFYQLTGSL